MTENAEKVKAKLAEGKRKKIKETVDGNLEEDLKLKGIDASKIVTLDGDEEGDEMLAQEDIIIDEEEQRTILNKDVPLEQDDEFHREYMKMGGIQHIICSATMTINKLGRVTPR